MKIITVNSKVWGVKEILIDDVDYQFLNQYKWQVLKNTNRNTFYATSRQNGKTVYMHRLLLGLTNRKTVADHIDLNGLNNQRTNLRAASIMQNNCNRDGEKNHSSKYKGVHWEKQTGKWRASIGINGRELKLGRFINEEDAAIAYNIKAIEWHGEFAYLNKTA